MKETKAVGIAHVIEDAVNTSTAKDEPTPKKKLVDLARELTRNFKRINRQRLDEHAGAMIEDSKKKLTETIIEEARNQKDRIVRDVCAPKDLLERVSSGLKEFFEQEGFSVQCEHLGEGAVDEHGSQHLIRFTIDWAEEKPSEEKVIATKVNKDETRIRYHRTENDPPCTHCGDKKTLVDCKRQRLETQTTGCLPAVNPQCPYSECGSSNTTEDCNGWKCNTCNRKFAD
ncbi:MAG: hypothetical protein AAB682_02680 [Patescibacteria group bacterium]